MEKVKACIIGTGNIGTDLKRVNCNRFIGVGSKAEYGICENEMSKDTKINPVTAYGVAKYSAYKLSKILCDDLNMEHIWTRVLSVYGIYDNENTMIQTSIKSFLEGVKPLYTKGEQQWDYLFSEDAGRAFYLIGEMGANGETYLIGSGKTKSLKEYIKIIRDSIDKDLEIGIGEIPYAENQVMYLKANIENLKRDTGFIPKYEFEEGIKKTISFYKEGINYKTKEKENGE